MTTYKHIIKKYIVHTIKNNVQNIGRKGQRYTTLSKRIILNRRGYTVHSPFVYSFIHNVIKNNKAYYCYPILKEETHTIRKEIEQDKNSNSIYRVSLLELVFRISHYNNINSIIIVNDRNSAVPYYIKSEKYSVIQLSSNQYISYKARENSITIFEDIDEEVINNLYNNIENSNNRGIFILSTRNKHIKEKVISIAEEYKNKFASIELNNMDIWFLDKNLSPKRAKVYYK